MKQFIIKLTDNQIRNIRHDKQILSQMINSGKCCEVLDDTGLSAIDLHGLMVQLEKALSQGLDIS